MGLAEKMVVSRGALNQGGNEEMAEVEGRGEAELPASVRVKGLGITKKQEQSERG